MSLLQKARRRDQRNVLPFLELSWAQPGGAVSAKRETTMLTEGNQVVDKQEVMHKKGFVISNWSVTACVLHGTAR